MITVQPNRAHLWAGLAAAAIVGLTLGLLIWRSARFVPAPLNLASTAQTDTYRPVVNLPWVRYGADFGGVTKWHTPGISDDAKTIDS